MSERGKKHEDDGKNSVRNSRKTKEIYYDGKKHVRRRNYLYSDVPSLSLDSVGIILLLLLLSPTLFSYDNKKITDVLGFLINKLKTHKFDEQKKLRAILFEITRIMKAGDHTHSHSLFFPLRITTIWRDGVGFFLKKTENPSE